MATNYVFSFRNDPNGLDALRWWTERCLEWCYSEPEHFGDQRYLQEWPTSRPGVHVLRHPGGQQTTLGGYATVAANNIIFRQSRTPEPLLSRVNTSGRILASGAGTSLGALIGGAVADAAGVGWAIATGAGFAALSALIGWLSPLRREPLRAA